uniref:Uncharacterized protein n=1 Tax=Romanomermis culicivorax TaxID=13658 RepID=A0A915HT19_ROMCU
MSPVKFVGDSGLCLSFGSSEIGYFEAADCRLDLEEDDVFVLFTIEDFIMQIATIEKTTTTRKTAQKLLVKYNFGATVWIGTRGLFLPFLLLASSAE